MADKNRYPQIPSTVWWGVRSILQKTPTATIDERYLGVQLSVQEAAARAYIAELRAVGLITEDNKATALANRWRLDESYADAVEEIVRANYPEGLINVAPPGEADRQKVVSWFMREGLGQGAAGNKAASYMLLSTPTPNEAPRTTPKSKQGDAKPRNRNSSRQNQTLRTPEKRSTTAASASNSEDIHTSTRRPPTHDVLPLNVNVQIHISADAGTEQIESIFQAMRRYLYDGTNT